MLFHLGMSTRPPQQIANQKSGPVLNQMSVPGQNLPFEQQGLLGNAPGAGLLGPGPGTDNQQVGPLFPGAPGQGPQTMATPWGQMPGMPVAHQMNQQQAQHNVPQTEENRKHPVGWKLSLLH